MFFSMGFRLPFNDFEAVVLNHLKIFTSQLHIMSWAYVKVFQYWCEYRNGVPAMKLFFYLFNMKHTSTKAKQGKGFLSFHQAKKMFDFFSDNFKNFKDWYFLAVSQSRETHSSLCVLPECSPSFPHG